MCYNCLRYSVELMLYRCVAQEQQAVRVVAYSIQVCVSYSVLFAQQRNRLRMHFSERLPIVKRCMTVVEKIRRCGAGHGSLILKITLQGGSRPRNPLGSSYSETLCDVLSHSSILQAFEGGSAHLLSVSTNKHFSKLLYDGPVLGRAWEGG